MLLVAHVANGAGRLQVGQSYDAELVMLTQSTSRREVQLVKPVLGRLGLNWPE